MYDWPREARMAAIAAIDARRDGSGLWVSTPVAAYLATDILNAIAPLIRADERERTGAEVTRLTAELEHARSALAGDSEGARLWMLDCASLADRHRARADEAEAKLARAVAGNMRETVRAILAEDTGVAETVLARIEAVCRARLDNAADADVPESRVSISALDLLAIISDEEKSNG
jgi:hypothetical protein